MTFVYWRNIIKVDLSLTKQPKANVSSDWEQLSVTEYPRQSKFCHLHHAAPKTVVTSWHSGSGKKRGREFHGCSYGEVLSVIHSLGFTFYWLELNWMVNIKGFQAYKEFWSPRKQRKEIGFDKKKVSKKKKLLNNN